MYNNLFCTIVNNKTKQIKQNNKYAGLLIEVQTGFAMNKNTDQLLICPNCDPGNLSDELPIWGLTGYYQI